MANENEQIKDGENKEEPKTGNGESWIERTLEKIDEEFPLSGGETDEDLTFWEEGADDATPKKEKTEEDLDTKFPLSGGETDADL